MCITSRLYALNLIFSIFLDRPRCSLAYLLFLGVPDLSMTPLGSLLPAPVIQFVGGLFGLF